LQSIRLIAMDMDGTLLNPAQKLSEGNRKALLAAEAAGVKLAICSGRMPADGALFALENGLENCAVLGLNGGCCQKSPKDEPYVNHTLPKDSALDCLRRFHQAGVTHACFLQNHVVVFQGRQDVLSRDWGSHWGLPGGTTLTYGGDGAQLAERGINKIVCVDDDPQLLAELRQFFDGDGRFQATSSWINNLEIMPPGVDKGLAVEELTKEMQLTADQVMAIGDFDNDLSMLAYAGFSVAMGNGSQLVKEICDAVTLTNAQDGVAVAIRQYVLGEEMP